MDIEELFLRFIIIICLCVVVACCCGVILYGDKEQCDTASKEKIIDFIEILIKKEQQLIRYSMQENKK